MGIGLQKLEDVTLAAAWDVDRTAVRGKLDATPIGPADGSARVVRGGSWSYHGRRCRSAYRYSGVPSQRFINVGFRVAVAVAAAAPPH